MGENLLGREGAETEIGPENISLAFHLCSERKKKEKKKKV